MSASKDRPTSSLRRHFDAVNSYAGDRARSMLSYVPARHIGRARARDLTLQAGFIPPCLPMTAPAAPSGESLAA